MTEGQQSPVTQLFAGTLLRSRTMTPTEREVMDEMVDTYTQRPKLGNKSVDLETSCFSCRMEERRRKAKEEAESNIDRLRSKERRATIKDSSTVQTMPIIEQKHPL